MVFEIKRLTKKNKKSSSSLFKGINSWNCYPSGCDFWYSVMTCIVLRFLLSACIFFLFWGRLSWCAMDICFIMYCAMDIWIYLSCIEQWDFELSHMYFAMNFEVVSHVLYRVVGVVLTGMYCTMDFRVVWLVLRYWFWNCLSCNMLRIWVAYHVLCFGYF